MSKIIKVPLILGVTFLFCFIIGEVTIRAFYGYFSNYNMEMCRYSAELKKSLSFDKLPFHHFPNRVGIYYGVKISTNSLGMREREFRREKIEGQKRIIFLGDSFTLGWGVPFDKTFVKQVEQHLRNRRETFETVNMGVGNYNSVMEVELFKKKGLNLNPDLVVLVYNFNDVEPIPKQLEIGTGILKHSYFMNFCFDRYVKLKVRFSKNFSWKNYYRNLYFTNSRGLAINRKAIQELIDICADKGIALLIVNIPELHELKEYPFPFATNFIQELAERRGVPFLDLLSSFRMYRPESLWVSGEDPHPNVKAHTIIAQSIFLKIMNDVLKEGS